MNRSVVFPELTGEQLVELQRLLRFRSTPHTVHRRAQVIGALAAGASLAEASEEAGLHYTNAHHCLRRYREGGVAGLQDRPRSGRPPRYGAEVTTATLKAALARPPELGLGFTTWSLPKLEQYLREQKGLPPVTRATIRRRLLEAGLRFRGRSDLAPR